jgi:hypothetical protein
MNNSVGKTDAGLVYDTKDARETLKAVRKNLVDRDFIYNTVLAFVARNWGMQQFRAADLRQAIGYTANDMVGPKHAQKMTDVIHMILMHKIFSTYVSANNENYINGKRVALYGLAAEAVALYANSTPLAPYPVSTMARTSPVAAPGFTASTVDQVLTEVSFVSPQSKSNDTLSMDEAIDLIKRLYVRNQEYEATISDLLALNQNLEAQVRQSTVPAAKIDAELRKIIKSA